MTFESRPRSYSPLESIRRINSNVSYLSRDIKRAVSFKNVLAVLIAFLIVFDLALLVLTASANLVFASNFIHRIFIEDDASYTSWDHLDNQAAWESTVTSNNSLIKWNIYARLIAPFPGIIKLLFIILDIIIIGAIFQFIVFLKNIYEDIDMSISRKKMSLIRQQHLKEHLESQYRSRY